MRSSRKAATYRQLAVSLMVWRARPLRSLTLSDGSRLKADHYVFACGPWLGKLFPETLGKIIRPTKQDIFFFGAARRRLPLYRRASSRVGRSRQSVSSTASPAATVVASKWPTTRVVRAFDPTSGERVVSQATLKRVREYIAFRFPAMKDAPLIETRVCQYEQTPDSNFIVDRHPRMENVWLLGGGSGHGFKHGPALGEMMAELDFERWRSQCRLAAVAVLKAKIKILNTEDTEEHRVLRCVPPC